MSTDETLDARDLLCPLPVLKARKALLRMAAGQRLTILATDPAALVDIPHFCAQSGHTLLSVTDVVGGQSYAIIRGNTAG